MPSLAAPQVSTRVPIILGALGQAKFSKAYNRTLAVITVDENDTPQSCGSAVMVSPDGGILTAAHVIKTEAGMKNLVRPLASEKANWVQVQIVAISEEEDLALLLIPELSGGRPYYTNKLAILSGTVEKGSNAYTFGLGSLVSDGNALGYKNCKEGFIPDPALITGKRLVTSTNAKERDSGGLVVNSNCELIGITLRGFLKGIKIDSNAGVTETELEQITTAATNIALKAISNKLENGGIKFEGELQGIAESATIEAILAFLEQTGVNINDVLDGEPIRKSLGNHPN